jgi:DNA-binding CsgD family transcriptional regulator
MALLNKLKQIWGSDKKTAFEKEADPTEEGRLKRIMSLTPREHDLFLLLLEGFTLKESAKQLSVKYSTANTHMTSIYKKLNVNSRAELIINYH